MGNGFDVQPQKYAGPTLSKFAVVFATFKCAQEFALDRSQARCCTTHSDYRMLRRITFYDSCGSWHSSRYIKVCLFGQYQIVSKYAISTVTQKRERTISKQIPESIQTALFVPRKGIYGDESSGVD